MRQQPLPYWVIPILGGLVWLVTLLALLLYWVINTSSMFYSSMSANQTIAFISDIGADTLKPLFVIGCVLTAILLDLSLFLDFYFRRQPSSSSSTAAAAAAPRRTRRGLLLPNQTRAERALAWLTLAFAAVGTVGLCCLSGFDTERYRRLHLVFLMLFILGYLASAICLCFQYCGLGKRYRDEQPSLRISFYTKVAFVVIEIALAAAFVVLLLGSRRHNQAAIVEWALAIIFSFYIFSFAADLYPATAASVKEAAAGDAKSANTVGGGGGGGGEEQEERTGAAAV